MLKTTKNMTTAIIFPKSFLFLNMLLLYHTSFTDQNLGLKNVPAARDVKIGTIFDAQSNWHTGLGS